MRASYLQIDGTTSEMVKKALVYITWDHYKGQKDKWLTNWWEWQVYIKEDKHKQMCLQ